MADIFIKIDGIAGESQDATHPDEIEVLTWGWEVKQRSSMRSGSGGGAAKATVEDCDSSMPSTGQAQIWRVTAFAGSIYEQPY